MVAAEGRDDAQPTVDIEPEQNAVERIETVASEDTTSRLAVQSDREDTVEMVNDDPARAPSPEGASTGPLLQWSEFHPGIQRPGVLLSTGDGRVVMGGQTPGGEPHFIITADGDPRRSARTRVDSRVLRLRLRTRRDGDP